jgi:hypothetical protein
MERTDYIMTFGWVDSLWPQSEMWLLELLLRSNYFPNPVNLMEGPKAEFLQSNGMVESDYYLSDSGILLPRQRWIVENGLLMPIEL